MYSRVLNQDFGNSRDGMALLHGGWGKTRRTVFRFSSLSGEFGGDRLHFLIFHRPGKFGAQPARTVLYVPKCPECGVPEWPARINEFNLLRGQRNA
jgi:hypothetical protein